MRQRKRSYRVTAKIWYFATIAVLQLFCIVAWSAVSHPQGIAQTVANHSNSSIVAQTSSSENAPTALIRAQTLNAQGANQLAAGQAEAALETWKQAEAAYKAANDERGTIGSQLNQVQALQALGQYRRARTTLEQIDTQLQRLPDSDLKADGLRSLGVTRFRVGDLKEAQAVLQASLTISQRLSANAGQSQTLIALGNVARALTEQAKRENKPERNNEAIVFYQRAATLAPDALRRSQAKLNQLSLLAQINPTLDQTPLLAEIRSLLKELPLNRASIYAQVNLAESLMQLSNQDQRDIAQLLVNATQQARELRDPRAEAYSLGQLGHLYETQRQWSDAQKVTQQALQIAQTIQANDIAVSWQWQLGRVLKQQGKMNDAIAAYNQAVETLSILRGDLIAMNPEVQFSFREQVEPIYRQLVQLLLQDNPNQTALRRAREVIEALQLAELNNFFREACLDVRPQQIDQADPSAAVVYSILLPDRLAVILSLPGQPLRYHTPSVSSDSGTIEKAFDDLFATLNPFIATSEPLRSNQKLYDLLIRPVAKDLAQSQVKTLVFVLDGILRGIPIAALHDGQQYLIEQYSIALSPSLQLLPPRWQNRSPAAAVPSDELQTLAGGVSEARQGFSPLPGVVKEVEQISALVPANVLLNQAFTRTQFESRIESVPFPIVHLATHGQFSSQAENTFLLTWDGRINVREFDQLLESRNRQDRRPIELLILSACQTATGDRRAALGLAGIAVRSGARSTIATLWSVQDDSTAILMTQLYEKLRQPGISRAEALRQAQLTLLRSSDYQHPFYWAPFVLVGNWQ
ncbi:CHAT domain-containing protein [Pseudanabaenaceae cyanobacterium LEGE 13415]|nr:CHAT domain-containing protein [Pseudanabaenaceae cyanobacterium LEGE 13415]